MYRWPGWLYRHVKDRQHLTVVSQNCLAAAGAMRDRSLATLLAVWMGSLYLLSFPPEKRKNRFSSISIHWLASQPLWQSVLVAGRLVGPARNENTVQAPAGLLSDQWVQPTGQGTKCEQHSVSVYDLQAVNDV